VLAGIGSANYECNLMRDELICNMSSAGKHIVGRGERRAMQMNECRSGQAVCSAAFSSGSCSDCERALSLTGLVLPFVGDTERLWWLLFGGDDA
jgi:hypothetical protein